MGPWVLTALKVFGSLGLAAGVFAAAYWVTAELKSLGGLEEQVEQGLAAHAQAVSMNEELRTEIAELALAVTRRDTTVRAIGRSINELRAAAGEIKHACDPEPLDPVYVDQLRRAAAIADGTGTDVSNGTGGVD